jgi:preprotein translocase subunit Sec61beta
MEGWRAAVVDKVKITPDLLLTMCRAAAVVVRNWVIV